MFDRNFSTVSSTSYILNKNNFIIETISIMSNKIEQYIKDSVLKNRS